MGEKAYRSYRHEETKSSPRRQHSLRDLRQSTVGTRSSGHHAKSTEDEALKAHTARVTQACRGKQDGPVSFLDHQGKMYAWVSQATHDGHADETACDSSHLELLQCRHLFSAVDLGWRRHVDG